MRKAKKPRSRGLRWLPTLPAIVGMAVGWAVAQANPLPAMPESSALPDTLAARLHDAYAENPDSPESVAVVAYLYHANGLLDQAVATYQALTRMDPENPRWLYLRALAARDLGDQLEFERLCRSAIDLGSRYPPLFLNLADRLAKGGEREDARNFYEACLRADPDNPWAHMGLGRIALERGRYDDAEAHLLAAIEADDRFSTAFILLENLFRKTNRPEQAEAARTQALGKNRYKEPPDPWARHLIEYSYDPYYLQVLAAAESHAGNPSGAIPILERAQAFDPDDPETLAALGDAYRTLDQPEAALRYYRQAAQTDPSNEYALTRLGETLREQGHLEESLAVFRDGIDALVDKTPALNGMGITLEALGRTEAAEQAYRQALAIDPNKKLVLKNFGALLMSQEKTEGIGLLHRYLELQPDDVEIRLHLGAYFGDRGYLNEAIDYLSQAHRFAPRNEEAAGILGRALLNRGHAYLQQGRLQQAIEDLQRSLSVDGSDPRAHLDLAIAWLQEGRIQNALAVAEQGHRLADQMGLLDLAEQLRALADTARRERE